MFSEFSFTTVKKPPAIGSLTPSGSAITIFRSTFEPASVSTVSAFQAILPDSIGADVVGLGAVMSPVVDVVVVSLPFVAVVDVVESSALGIDSVTEVTEVDVVSSPLADVDSVADVEDVIGAVTMIAPSTSSIFLSMDEPLVSKIPASDHVIGYSPEASSGTW